MGAVPRVFFSSSKICHSLVPCMWHMGAICSRFTPPYEADQRGFLNFNNNCMYNCNSKNFATSICGQSRRQQLESRAAARKPAALALKTILPNKVP